MKPDFPDSFLSGLIGKTNRSEKKTVRISRWEVVRKDFLEYEVQSATTHVSLTQISSSYI